MELIEDKIFDRVDFAKSPLGISEYDSCTFKHCLFTTTSLVGSVFIDCVFEDSDLSNLNTIPHQRGLKHFDTLSKLSKLSMIQLQILIDRKSVV